MDLQLYGRVLWRHKWLLAAGFTAALALAALSVVRVEFKDDGPTLSYRQPEIWQARTRVLLTKGDGSGVFEDPDSLGALTSFYAELVATDTVQFQVLTGTGGTAALVAAPVVDPISENPGPFLDILGLAESPRSAARISDRGAEVFIEYVSERQKEADISERDRVVPQVVKRPFGPKGPELVQARKKTTPAFVFLAVLTATFGLIFVVENARGRRTPPSVPVAAEPEQKSVATEPEDEYALALHESGKGLLSGRRWGMEP